MTHGAYMTATKIDYLRVSYTCKQISYTPITTIQFVEYQVFLLDTPPLKL